MDTVSTYVGIITSILSTLALLAGGLWAYWIFTLKRTGKWNLGMTIQTETLSYSNDPNLRLLKVIIRLKNTGSVKVTPGEKGLVLKIIKINETSECYQIVDCFKGKIIYPENDLLQKYRHPQKGYGNYEIEPGNEYTEIETIVVKENDLLSMRCQFYSNSKDDSITEYAIIRIKTPQ